MKNKAMAFFRKEWAASDLRFAPSDYRQGYPLPDGNGGWALKPWPADSDFGPFAEKAAAGMLEIDPDAFPMDICSFGAHLRYSYILESMDLPIDPEGLNVVRLMEAIIMKEGTNMPQIGIIRERMLSMLDNLAGQVTIEGSREETEEFRTWCLDRVTEGKDPFSDMAAIKAAFPGLIVRKGGKQEEGGVTE